MRYACSSTTKSDENISEEKISIHDIPQSGPVVSPSFWEDEYFDDLDLNMKLRYLKGNLNYQNFFFVFIFNSLQLFLAIVGGIAMTKTVTENCFYLF